MGNKTITDVWPLFGLRVTTPRLTLAYPTDEMIVGLVEVADRGIHPEGENPFSSNWSALPEDERAVSIAQYRWSCRGTHRPDDWHLPFAIVIDGEVAGSQDLFGKNFAATRIAGSGSFLGEKHQGKGYGTEARRAVLYLLFEGLGAEIAQTDAWASNERSIRVTERLGYVPNGRSIRLHSDGDGRPEVHYRLDRAVWEKTRPDDIEIDGLEPCLPLLGL